VSKNCKVSGLCNVKLASWMVPVATCCKAHVVCDSSEHWDRGFESRSRHGCMSAFVCVVLYRAGRDPVMGRSPVQGVLPSCLNGFIKVKVKLFLCFFLN
jgi:hypothetical protein